MSCRWNIFLGFAIATVGMMACAPFDHGHMQDEAPPEPVKSTSLPPVSEATAHDGGAVVYDAPLPGDSLVEWRAVLPTTEAATYSGGGLSCTRQATVKDIELLLDVENGVVTSAMATDNVLTEVTGGIACTISHNTAPQTYFTTTAGSADPVDLVLTANDGTGTLTISGKLGSPLDVHFEGTDDSRTWTVDAQLVATASP